MKKIIIIAAIAALVAAYFVFDLGTYLTLAGIKQVAAEASGFYAENPALVLAAIMAFVTLLTNFASNATAATVGTPIAFNIATQLGLPPEPLILAVLFGCNLCYATPIAYQTNMLIMAEGSYEFRDYIRTGVPLVGLMVAVLSVLLVLFYGM